MSIGARLSSARIGLGLSVQDVSARTRLRAGIIENLEADYLTYDAEVFVKAHIKSVASAVGEDYEQLIAMLTPPVDEEIRTTRRYRRGASVEQTPSAELTAEADLDIFVVGSREVLPPRRSGNIRAIIVGVIAVGLVLAGVRFAVSHFSTTSPPTSEPSITESVKPTTDPTNTSGPSSAPTVTETAADGSHGVVGSGKIVVELKCTGASWVKVENDYGDVMFDGEVADGDSFEFRDDISVKVTVGKAENIKFRANRVYVGRLGTGKQTQIFDEVTVAQLTGKS